MEISIEDLNEKHIQGCIRNGVEGGRIPDSALNAPIADTLSKWNLLRNGILTNGAVMLFSNNIQGFPNFRLRMARFIGTDKDEFLDNQQTEGNFFDLLDAGLAFCFKHLNLSSRITNHSVYREDRLEIPYKALRETLINSLCHRQWEHRNLTNSIAIYDDRVEIGNPGVFPPQITPDNIKLPHDSYPYNLNVAATLYRSLLLESWGSGARRIMEACQEQGVEEPTWRWDGAFVYVIFNRPNTINHQVPPKQPLSNPHVPPKQPLSTPQVDLLVEYIDENYTTLKELAEACKITNLKYFREMFIKPALDLGVIERLYPDHPKHPKQKYRLRRDLSGNVTNKTQEFFHEGEQTERKKGMRIMLSFGISPEKIAEEYGISVQDVMRLAQT